MGLNGQNKMGVKGLKIQHFNAGMILVTLVLCGILLYATAIVSARYRELVMHTEEYTAWEKNAATVNEASDYLTEQVRLYTQTTSIEHMALYFEEANVTRRREKVLAELEAHYSDENVSASLEAAVQSSNDLMEREIYAMKLISAARGYHASLLPTEVRVVKLAEADAALEPQEMIERARVLVFDLEYQGAKAQIEGYVSQFMEGVLASMKLQQEGSVERLSSAISMQRLLLMVLLMINLLTFAVITLLVIQPIRVFLRCVREQSLFEVTGAYEFRYLAQVYNEIYERNAASAAKEAVLRHQAEHDPLTGVMNRNVFGRIHSLLKETRGPTALLLIDVDRFKDINDSYGHEVGDQMLKKIALLLAENFHAKDYLFRIGGDEFAVVVVGVSQDKSQVIEERVRRINHILCHPEDGLPAVSLSVGVAFSGAGYREELFGQADQALYLMKKQGRCGCRVYSKAQDAEPASR